MFGAASEKLGFNERTLEEEDIAFMQFCGLYPLNKFYTIYYFTSTTISLFTLGGMVVRSYLDEEMDVAFETAHVLLIATNMFTQNLISHYCHHIVEMLLRAIDKEFYSYGDTMDEETKKIINELNNEKIARKKMSVKLFKFQVACAGIGVIVKRLLLVLFTDSASKKVDGENWGIYQAPLSIYIPYSNYWGPYLLGMFLSCNSVLTIALTAMGAATTFIRFSEELLQQLQIIKLGLRNVLARAHHLHTIKYGRPYPLVNGETKEDFDKCLSICLIKSVEHHTIVIKLFEEFKKMMKVPLFTVIFDGGALICMSMALLITSESASMKLLMPSFIAAELYYTYIYCAYGEKLTNLFTEIGDQLFLADWLIHQKTMKPYMLIMKAYSFYPKKLTAGGFTTPNLESFGNVLRTAYSLLNFLVTQQ
uniref:Odorant receptor n=1 Tax=Adelphocoris lineolatus TaxID=236346 RepID=A0A2I4PH42_ADELI|nr:olfactory receptor 40 [Adelphocoris lineolatus]